MYIFNNKVLFFYNIKKVIIKNFNKMEFLEEEYLVEATVPTYRDILLNLIMELTTNEELKRILNSSEREKLEFHHIDSIYDEVGFIIKRKKARNNDPSNIALVYADAHKALTKLNRTCTDPSDKIKNLEKLAQNEYKNKIFPLNTCLPHLIAKSLEKAMQEVV